MEPPKAEIASIPHSPDFKIRQVVYTKAEVVVERNGEWWVHFEGSRESMCFGSMKPWETGDTIKITFEKVDPLYAKP